MSEQANRAMAERYVVMGFTIVERNVEINSVTKDAK
jgi:hypothetical protein